MAQVDSEVFVLRVRVGGRSGLPEGQIQNVILIVINVVTKLLQPRIRTVLSKSRFENILEVDNGANAAKDGRVSQTGDNWISHCRLASMWKVFGYLACANQRDFARSDRAAITVRLRSRLCVYESGADYNNEQRQPGAG